MGTHPIFESDFDCLTEKCFVAFRLSDRLLARSGSLVWVIWAAQWL